MPDRLRAADVPLPRAGSSLPPLLSGPSNTRISCGGGAEPPWQRADPVSCIRLFDSIRVLSWQILEAYAAPVADGRTCVVYPAEELRVMFEPILEPVFLSLKTDQDPGRPTVTGYQDLLICG